MKVYVTAFILFTAIFAASAQKSRSKLDPHYGKSMIFGSFVQRLGFSSGGFAQYVSVMDLGTRKEHPVPVKPTFKSARENAFLFYLPPGRYAIMTYNWTRSTWYGGNMHTEYIVKNGPYSQIAKQLDSGTLKESDLKWYEFTVQADTPNYLGTWHFDTENVSFSNDMEKPDSTASQYLNRERVRRSVVSIPE